MGKRIRPVQKYAVKIFLPAALYIFAKRTGLGLTKPSPPERSQSEARLLARHRGARLRAGEMRARGVQPGSVTLGEAGMTLGFALPFSDF